MYKVIKAAKDGAASRVPQGFESYYIPATKLQAEKFGYDSEYIATPDIIELYQSYGMRYDGIILAKPEYQDSLGDSGLGLLDVVIENGARIAVYNMRDRVYSVDLDEVERAIGI